MPLIALAAATLMNPRVTAESVTGLAIEMTWKTALIGGPSAGAKAGSAR